MQLDNGDLNAGEPHRYDPYSYNAVLSKIVSELGIINEKLDESIKEQRDSNLRINQQIASLDERIDKRISELEKRVISLEYYKYYLAGITAICSAIAGYVFNKFFDLKKD